METQDTRKIPDRWRAVCPECKRVFDLLNEEQAAEWYYGHDCEEAE